MIIITKENNNNTKKQGWTDLNQLIKMCKIVQKC